MTDLLDNLRTPQQIAERIKAASGAHITARAVWEKARRLGIAKKIGRSMLISVDDIPLLLEEETKTGRRERLTAIRTGEQTLAALRQARAARERVTR
jgi:hypothetical protein